MVVAATLASALAWSGVGLIAFVPLVGLAVFPLQIAALLIRGLVFEYIGLTALGAYVTLYRRHVRARRVNGASAARISDSVHQLSGPGVGRWRHRRRVGGRLVRGRRGGTTGTGFGSGATGVIGWFHVTGHSRTWSPQRRPNRVT